MKYVLLLISAIVMTASCQSGILNVNAISDKDIREYVQGIDGDQILSAFESLKSGEINNQWLQGIDGDQILSAFESLHAQDGLSLLRGLPGLGTDDGAGYSGGFVLILVLFILLVIIGAGFGLGISDGIGDDKNGESSAGFRNGGYIPLMTMK